MLSIILPLILATLQAVSAAPTLSPRALGEHEILLFGANGTFKVMNKTEWAAINTLQSRPADVPAAGVATSIANSNSSLSKRCDSATIYQFDTPTKFLNWDVPMSSVVYSTNTTGATVAVTEGFMIANALTTSVSVDETPIKDVLTITMGISTTQTWTSTYTAGYTFPVPAGKYGVVVSNPATTRQTGRWSDGCIGQAVDVVSFTCDYYESHAYGGLSWVEGTISLCTGDTYPVPMCNGDGILA